MIITESATTPEGKPFCVVRWDQESLQGQMTPDEMRKFGQHCMETAEAAETDALLLLYMTKVVGLEPEQFATMLQQVRVFRGEARKRAGDEK